MRIYIRDRGIMVGVGEVDYFCFGGFFIWLFVWDIGILIIWG